MLASLVRFGVPLDRRLLLETVDEGEIRSKSLGELFRYSDLLSSCLYDPGASVGLEQSLTDPKLLATTSVDNASDDAENGAGHVPCIEEPGDPCHGLSLGDNLMTQEEEIPALRGTEQIGNIQEVFTARPTSLSAGMAPAAAALRTEDCIDPIVFSLA